MFHKTNFGYVDLTFDRCADKTIEISEMIKEQLGDFQQIGFSIHKTGKSAVLRLSVPVLDMKKPFEEQLEAIEECFRTIREMTKTAGLLSYRSVMVLLKKE